MAILKRNPRRVRVYTELPNVKYGVVIDQRNGSEACLNYAGWPANEISLLVKLQQDNPDSALARSIERGLVELPTPQVDNSAKTNEELIGEIIPKYVGTLSEYLKWVESRPLSASERAILDEQAKQQFGDDSSSDISSSVEASTDASS